MAARTAEMVRADMCGYEKAAQISLLAYREDLSLKDAALKLGYLTAEQFDEWVRPEDMTHPLTK
jgi:fumarate hydratase class II